MNFLMQNIEDLKAMLPQLQTLRPQVDAATAAIAESLLAGGKMLAAGNGGSAADASHLTTEFVCRYHKNRKPYAALSLATHGGDLTAIGNDYAFDDIFSRQVEAFGRKGAQDDDIEVAKVYEKAGAKVSNLDLATVNKWRDIARDTAWKDYGAKTATAANLLKLASDVSA